MQHWHDGPFATVCSLIPLLIFWSFALTLCNCFVTSSHLHTRPQLLVSFALPPSSPQQGQELSLVAVDELQHDWVQAAQFLQGAGNISVKLLCTTMGDTWQVMCVSLADRMAVSTSEALFAGCQAEPVSKQGALAAGMTV